MSYIAPTFAEFLQRFPEFQGTPDEIVLAVLDEALGETDESWGDVDRRAAGLYLAAHMLALEGYPARNEGGDSPATLAGTGGILREKVGDVETQYAGVSGSTAAEVFGQTVYGRRYLALLKRNQPAVFVI